MKVVSVNVSLPKEIVHEGKAVLSGIFKDPVGGRVAVARLGLAGDGQADLEVHGGVDKAVYAYPHEHYPHWQQELGRSDLPFGQLGENLTTEGLLEEELRIGDVLRVGTVVLEVSQPRVPCFKLGIKMGRSDFVKMFLGSLRTGFYLRVIEEGELAADDSLERVSSDPSSLTVRDVCRLAYFDRSDLDGAARAAALEKLERGWREKFEKRLAAAQRG